MPLSHDAAPARQAARLFTFLLAGLTLGAAVVLGAELVKRQSPPGFALLGAWLGLVLLLARGVRAGGNDWRIPAALLVAGALALRTISVGLVDGVALHADPMNYANLAQALLEGRGLVTDDWQYGRDLRAYFPPLYPLLLAGWWAMFGDSMLATALLNTLTDALAAWGLADAGRRLGQAAAGRFAGLVYFAWPAFTMAAGMPQKESLTLLLAILMLRGIAGWLADAPTGARRWRHGLWLGVWYGLLALTQPSLVMAPVAIALVLMAQRGVWPVARLGLTALPTFLLVLTPWLIRNWLLFHALVPFTTASGMMVNAAVYRGPVPFPDTLFDLPEHTRGSMMGGLAWRAILADPLTWLWHGVVNMAGHFAYEEAPLGAMRNFTPAIGPERHARLAPLLQGAWTLLLAASAAAGWRAVRRRRVDAVLLYALAVLLAIGAVNLWFEFGERHRLVLTPLLLLIASAAWVARTDETAGTMRA